MLLKFSGVSILSPVHNPHTQPQTLLVSLVNDPLLQGEFHRDDVDLWIQIERKFLACYVRRLRQQATAPTPQESLDYPIPHTLLVRAAPKTHRETGGFTPALLRSFQSPMSRMCPVGECLTLFPTWHLPPNVRPCAFTVSGCRPPSPNKTPAPPRMSLMSSCPPPTDGRPNLLDGRAGPRPRPAPVYTATVRSTHRA